MMLCCMRRLGSSDKERHGMGGRRQRLAGGTPRFVNIGKDGPWVVR